MIKQKRLRKSKSRKQKAIQKNKIKKKQHIMLTNDTKDINAFFQFRRRNMENLRRILIAATSLLTGTKGSRKLVVVLLLESLVAGEL